MGLNGFKDNGCKEEVYSKKEVDDKLKNLNLNVDLSEIEKQVADANSTANSAKSTANSAVSTANNANNTANSAISKANTNATSITNIQTATYGTPIAVNDSNINWYQVEKINNFVHVFLEINNRIPAGETKHLCTLPSGFIPSSGGKAGTVHQYNGDFNYFNAFTLGTDGTINIYNGSSVEMQNFRIELSFVI